MAGAALLMLAAPLVHAQSSDATAPATRTDTPVRMLLASNGNDTGQNVWENLEELRGRIEADESRIDELYTNGVSSKYFHANSAAADSSASGAESVAVGPRAVSAGAQGVAIGDAAAADGAKAVALGAESKAGGNASSAIGANAQATGTGSIAIGESNAAGNWSVSAGTHASAGGSRAVAIGADARADAEDSLAVGRGANAVANSVALGAFSSAARGANDHYTDATGNLVGQRSVGEVNVGQRQITGVAAGTAGTDAVNIDQLMGVANSAARTANSALLWDPAAGAYSATHLGTGPNRITNVAGGQVDSASTDAINGAQLHGAAKSIGEALGGGAGVDAQGRVTAPNYVLNGGTEQYDNVGDALSNVDRRTTKNTVSITELGDRIASGQVGLVQQDAITRNLTVGGGTDGSMVNFTNNLGDSRQIVGVASGVVGPGSTFAINGGQLYGVAASAAAALGGGASVRQDGTISGPSYHVGGATYNNVGGAITNLDGRVTTVEGTVTNLSNQINNGEVGLVRQDGQGRITVGADKGGATVDVGGTAGARTVTGVADGAIARDSKDAVNGGQIYDLSKQISNTNATVESSAGELTRRLDAVSVDSQAYTDQQMQSAVRSSNAYTDQQVGSVRRDASAGIASAMAITAIPQATDHGKSAMGVAGATYDGETGMAVGISRVSASGKWIFKGAANTNSRGAYGGAVGMARQW